VDPRAPVIVGVGQAEQRPDDPLTALEPIALLEQAARAAGDDAGHALLDAVDTVAVVSMVSWPYPDPGAVLGRRLGLTRLRRTMTSTVGGNSPQLLVNTVAPMIDAGEADVVLLGGAECVYTRWRARREPTVRLQWTNADDPPCPVVVGDDRAGSSPYEVSHGAAAPVQVYPLLETARRAGLDRSVADHQVAVSELWAEFSAVAAANPHAWSREARSAAEIRTVSPDNRMVDFPYLKWMCANIAVDQAAAVLLCSYATARTAGVPSDRMVFPRSGADAHDHFFVTERDRLDRSPAIAAAGRATLEAAGVGIDDVARFDLYSCFPVAVEIAMDALGLPGRPHDQRPLTVTGGLAFAGGPANNYPTHAIATMVAACREDPGSIGFVSALGWYATKHSVGCYSTTPPPDGFTRVDPAATQAMVESTPRREPAGPYSGPGTLEASSVGFDRDGTATTATVSVLAPDGRRALAVTDDADTLTALTTDGWDGRAVEVRAGDVTNRLEPA